MSGRPRAEDAGAFVPFGGVEGDVGGGYLIICDHAFNTLPERYGNLGLPESEFRRHIAYDPGALAVSRGIARRLGAPLVFSTFSRLLIDPNRGEDDPTLIMRLSDGAIVPGNRHVDAEERQRRISEFHRPYHQVVDEHIDRALAAGVAPALVSIHSYTPVWRGRPRPWHAGLLWDNDDRLVRPLLDGLRAIPSLVVGDNEPYSGSLSNDCMNRHGTQRGLAHALIEVRQDLIADDEGAELWAERIAAILDPIRNQDDLHEIRLPQAA